MSVHNDTPREARRRRLDEEAHEAARRHDRAEDHTPVSITRDEHLLVLQATVAETARRLADAERERDQARRAVDDLNMRLQIAERRIVQLGGPAFQTYPEAAR